MITVTTLYLLFFHLYNMEAIFGVLESNNIKNIGCKNLYVSMYASQ